MNVDEIHAILDKDPEIIMTVEEQIQNMKRAHIVTLDYFRQLMVNYRGWRPLSLEEYVAKLNGDKYTADKLEQRQKRFEYNEKIKRGYKLRPTKKD